MHSISCHRGILSLLGIIQEIIPGLPFSTVQHALTEARGDVNCNDKIRRSSPSIVYLARFISQFVGIHIE